MSSVYRDETLATNSGDEEVTEPRLIDDEIVAEHLARMVEIVEGALTDVDQLSSDLDDNRLAIGASVAWLVGDNARMLGEVAELMRARLTWLAGQNIFPLHGENEPF